jgi:HSP90 family molecular chaperone
MRDGLNNDENYEHFIRLKKKTARLLKAYIERQFKKKEKGITELISNALDAGEDNIDVSVGKGRITVENDGKEGISLKTVFDNLLNITNSTKTERRVQIGRFGLGFFSSLNYLENEDDELSIVSLRSDTCFRVTIGIKYEDGIKKYYIKDVESLTRQEAGRFARHLKGNGTSISMKIKALE